MEDAKEGRLYIVGTPIGNLGDLSPGPWKSCGRWTLSLPRTPGSPSGF